MKRIIATMILAAAPAFALDGELCLAQWHIYHIDIELAKQMREMRHLVQMRKEKEIVWTPALNSMAALVEKELKG